MNEKTLSYIHDTIRTSVNWTLFVIKIVVSLYNLMTVFKIRYETNILFPLGQ